MYTRYVTRAYTSSNVGSRLWETCSQYGKSDFVGRHYPYCFNDSHVSMSLSNMVFPILLDTEQRDMAIFHSRKELNRSCMMAY
jgi:hypothetical protein